MEPRMIGRYPTDSHILCTFRDASSDADIWSDALECMFAICDTLWLQSLEVPEEWGFRPGVGMQQWLLTDDGEFPSEQERNDFIDDHSLYAADLLDATEQELLYAGNVMTRYIELIRPLHSY